MTTATPQSNAFTLVELLVVIAIIAILAAIAFPAYNSFIARGAAAGCISNLRSLGTAITSYAADNGRLPRAFTGINPEVKNSDHLPSVLRSYLGLEIGTAANPTYAKVACCPGVTKALLPKAATSVNQINSYVLYSQNDMPSDRRFFTGLPAVPGSGGSSAGVGIFGRASAPKADGLPLVTLSGYINTNIVDQNGNPPTLASIPAIYEPNAEAHNWNWAPSPGVPLKCPHGKNMNVLFFDWHVGQVPADAYSKNGTLWKKR